MGINKCSQKPSKSLQLRLISQRHRELFFLDLNSSSSISEISSTARQVTDTITALDIADYEYAAMWTFFCQQVDSKAKIPLGKNIYKSVKRLLIQFVKRAGFVMQAILGPADKFISDDYYNQLKGIKWRRKGSDFYTDYLYSRADNKKYYARACGQYTRSCGVASLAKKDGLQSFSLTITLKPEFHRSSPKWNGMTPDQSARKMTKAWSAFAESLRNNRLRAEIVRNIEPHKDGTPHLQATVFTDESEKLNGLLRRAFADIADAGLHGIQLSETDNAYRSLLYTLKTIWPCSDDKDNIDWERIRAWKSQISGQCFSIISTVRKLAPAALFDAHRRGEFESKSDLAAVDRLSKKISIQWCYFGCDEYVQMHGSYYPDKDDAVADTNAKLSIAASEGDYANFTRIYTDAMNTRRLSPAFQKSGLKTSGSLGIIEVKAITELRTIRQVVRKFEDKIRDLEDWKWLLRNKYIGKKSPQRLKADNSVRSFLYRLKVSLTLPFLTNLNFVPPKRNNHFLLCWLT